MSGVTVSSLVAELLPIAESLFSLIDKIKTEAPDVWASVSQEFIDAENAWAQAKANAQKAAASIPATKQPENGDPPPVETGDPEVLAENLAGSSSVEQAAAGVPLGHYTL